VKKSLIGAVFIGQKTRGGLFFKEKRGMFLDKKPAGMVAWNWLWKWVDGEVVCRREVPGVGSLAR
jgi:hypothetical protein